MPLTGRALDVVVYKKEGCHLCDLVEAQIRSMNEVEISLTSVDIGRDAALDAKYWIRIPVVTVGGREVFEARMMDLEGKWKERLPSLLVAGQGLETDSRRREM